jgi:uncharacterized membrane protein
MFINAAKASSLLLLLGVATAWAADPINQRCPVLTDEAIDPAITVVWQGKTIGLCCQRCKRQFLDKPEAYAVNLPAVVSLSTPGAQAAPVTDATRVEVIPVQLPPLPPHGEEGAANVVPRLTRWLGRFHPVVVHLPIALGLAAAMAEIIYLLRRVPGARAAARFTSAGAALGAVPAVVIGWFAAASSSHPGLEGVLTWHRWLGTVAMVGFILASVTLEVIHHRQPMGRLRFLPVVLLSLAGLLVGLVGHLGGTLVFGPDHFQW